MGSFTTDAVSTLIYWVRRGKVSRSRVQRVVPSQRYILKKTLKNNNKLRTKTTAQDSSKLNLFFSFLNASLYSYALPIAYRAPHLSINLSRTDWTHKGRLLAWLSIQTSVCSNVCSVCDQWRKPLGIYLRKLVRLVEAQLGTQLEEEEEECLSTEPTQTLTNQFPESVFHPTIIGCIPVWDQRPTQIWTIPLVPAWGVSSGWS